MFYDIVDALSFFSFPSSPEFYAVVLLLQICSTYEIVYDHSCFCLYVYILGLSSMSERKHVCLSLAYFT
jgi:hypothetical protein